MIYRRGHSMRVMVYAGRDPLTGKKKWVSRQIRGTGRAALKEAKQIEAQLLAEVAAGRHQEGQGVKVAELVDRWLEWRQAVKPMSPGTAANYRRCIDLKIKPALGALAVNRLDTATLDRFYTELRLPRQQVPALLPEGAQRPAADASRRGLPPGLHRQGARARDGLRARHPDDGQRHPGRACRTVRRPATGRGVGLANRQPGPVGDPTSPGQGGGGAPRGPPSGQLIETATIEDPELGLFLMLAVMLGSRRGELCSLRWTDVDFDHGEVLIDSGVIYVPGRPLIDQDRTKNYTKRRVAIGPATLELLRAHRVEQAKVALASGVSLAPDAYVFSHQPDGSKPIRPDGVSHRFTKLARRLGVRCRLHDLRHFMVTHLVAAGVDVRTVAGRAGHVDGGRTTLSTYAHFQHAQDRHAAELLEGLLQLPEARTGR